MKPIRIILFFASFLFFGANAYAQQDSAKSDTTKQLYLIKKVDGTEFYGYIISDDGREILLETRTIGRIYIIKSEIKEITPVNNADVISNGGKDYKDYRNEGPFTTRYYFTTNALPIKKGENYALIQLYGPEVHFAVTDNLSLGVMASWIASPIGLATKYSFNSKGNTHFAIGTILASSGYLFNAQGFGGLHWLTLTQGTRSLNFSMSAGLAYVNLGKEFMGDDRYTFYSDYNSGQYIDYQAQQAIADKLYGNTDPSSKENLISPGTQSSIVIGMGGIAPVGKKASFIVDAMGFIGQADNIKNNPYPITVTYFSSMSNSNVTESYTITERSYVTGNTRFTLIVMPAMRFNSAYNKAFQVSLSGVIHISNGEVLSFPIPMVS